MGSVHFRHKAMLERVSLCTAAMLKKTVPFGTWGSKMKLRSMNYARCNRRVAPNMIKLNNIIGK